MLTCGQTRYARYVTSYQLFGYQHASNYDRQIGCTTSDSNDSSSPANISGFVSPNRAIKGAICQTICVAL